LTGGSGLLGKRVAAELRQAGFGVRAVARRIPPFSRRVPGVAYVSSDLGRGIERELLGGVGAIVHAAAETAGGKQDHQRNSVDATRHLIEAAAAAGVKDFIHISSLAVLKTSREIGRALDETAPLDAGTLRRGPYVWGKAESEIVAQRIGAERRLRVKIIRPGPLVDYATFHPPGRLGRELGPAFVAIGPSNGPLSVCDISTAARVIRSYLEAFDESPPVLNLIESPPPMRRELLGRYLTGRPDLWAIWFPAVLLQGLSGPLKILQRFALRSKQPVDIAAAFASERYKTDLAAVVIARAAVNVAAEQR
jgi:nucleoside-diphosphate-sugar epimerase